MQRLEVSGAVRPIYESLGVRWLITDFSVIGSRFNNIRNVFQGKGKHFRKHIAVRLQM